MENKKRKRATKKKPPDSDVKVNSTPKKKPKQDNKNVDGNAKTVSRPDVVKRLKERKGLETYTIKNGWASLKPHPIVQIGLNHLLPVVHQASIIAATPRRTRGALRRGAFGTNHHTSLLTGKYSTT